MITITEIKSKIKSPSSGGSIRIEGELGIRKIQYSDKYIVSHPAYIGDEIATIQTDMEFETILQKHQKYLDMKKELENQGYFNMGHGLYFLKDKDGNTIRDIENNIVTKSLYWGAK
jgi:hypothetical protein